MTPLTKSTKPVCLSTDCRTNSGKPISVVLPHALDRCMARCDFPHPQALAHILTILRGGEEGQCNSGMYVMLGMEAVGIAPDDRRPGKWVAVTYYEIGRRKACRALINSAYLTSPKSDSKPGRKTCRRRFQREESFRKRKEQQEHWGRS